MIQLHQIPRPRRGHHLEEVNGETVLFGRTSARTYFMNQTASVVWKLCDGLRSAQEIIDILSQAYPESAHDVAGDVIEVLQNLSDNGLVALEESAAPEAPPEPS